MVLAPRRVALPTLSQHGEIPTVLLYVLATVTLHETAPATIEFEKVEGDLM